MLKSARRLQQGAAPVQLPVSALHLLWNLAVALTVCSIHETSNGEKNVEVIALAQSLLGINIYLISRFPQQQKIGDYLQKLKKPL